MYETLRSAVSRTEDERAEKLNLEQSEEEFMMDKRTT